MKYQPKIYEPIVYSEAVRHQPSEFHIATTDTKMPDIHFMCGVQNLYLETLISALLEQKTQDLSVYNPIDFNPTVAKFAAEPGANIYLFGDSKLGHFFESKINFRSVTDPRLKSQVLIVQYFNKHFGTLEYHDGKIQERKVLNKKELILNPYINLKLLPVVVTKVFYDEVKLTSNPFN